MKKKKTCLIIYNPRSGKGKVKEKIDIYERILKENGYEVDIVGTKGIGSLWCQSYYDKRRR